MRSLLLLALVSALQAQVIRVNAGGPLYVDSGGSTWLADNGFAGGSTFVSLGPASGISNTSDPTLYTTGRTDTSAFSYAFNVSDGIYLVRLHFAEVLGAKAGQRIFGVKINNNTILSNFDIAARAGVNAALDLSFNVAILGNSPLTILFSRISGNPIVQAIDITYLYAVPNGTTFPGSCTAGQLFFRTDQPAGQNVYGCTTTGTPGVWTIQSGGGGSSNPITPGPGIVSSIDGSGIQTLSTDPTNVPRWSSQAGAPAGACTAGRDFNLNTSTNALYDCTQLNTWTLRSSTAPFFRAWAGGTALGSASYSGPGFQSDGLLSAALNMTALTIDPAGGAHYVYLMVRVPTGWGGAVNLKAFWTLRFSSSGTGTGNHDYALACKTPGTSNLNAIPTFSAAQVIAFNFTGTTYQVGQVDTPTTWTIPACSAGDIMYIRVVRESTGTAADLSMLFYFDVQLI